MNIEDEFGMVISEAAHEQELLSSAQWRSRVTNRNESHDDVNHFVTGRGFQKKYPTLGDTKVLRIPYEIHKEMETISLLLEGISSRNDVEYAHKIIDKIIEGLDNVP